MLFDTADKMEVYYAIALVSSPDPPVRLFSRTGGSGNETSFTVGKGSRTAQPVCACAKCIAASPRAGRIT